MGTILLYISFELFGGGTSMFFEEFGKVRHFIKTHVITYFLQTGICTNNSSFYFQGHKIINKMFGSVQGEFFNDLV